ncbi:hypothetical protein Nepgr_027925 [Nepenthes gracilis]|uniref:F-box protein SKIP14 n=1 Tax=Nepenthes gracilis TaxID=150966 RepID=A0AAD3Y1N7_NEPGR|nr:hypothetical protein Nepgr_027925 [Nepenthes gracilis]
MALNFSHRPIFPTHLGEDNLVSPVRIANGCLREGISERAGDGFVRTRHLGKEFLVCLDYGGASIEGGDLQESVSKDILDLLPGDPFGMDISSTFTGITGWLEDLEVDYGGYAEDEIGMSKGESLFTELNLIWDMGFQVFSGNSKEDGEVVAADNTGCSGEEKCRGSLFQGSFGHVGSMEVTHFGFTTTRIDHNQTFQQVIGSCVDDDAGEPHPALAFALEYLGVRDLLFVERVCKSLHHTVKNDPLLWKSIHIDQPLNDRITDDVLLQLTDRAQGNLQCLSLIECPRITDNGLKHVLESNPRLTKLSVPGCTRLSIDGVVCCLKDFNSLATSRMKHLRIGRLYGITLCHFEELKSVMGIDDDRMPTKNQKPHFYLRGKFYLSCEDDRPIDVEICPRCQNLRLVYDCPAENCQGKKHATQVCRACALCIARCVQCGRCINDGEYEETFCLELVCSSCWKQLLKCQELQDMMVTQAEYAINLEQMSSSYG